MKEKTAKQSTVKQKIFRSNTQMILVTFIAVLLVNLAIVKGYVELVEHKWNQAMEGILSEDQLKIFVSEWTVQQRAFRMLFVADLLLCAVILIIISRFFTAQLAKRVMEPLQLLSEGSKRIRKGNLTQGISYEGELEFQDACTTFNEMQQHILLEQQKNEKYERARTDMIAGISHDLRTPLTAIRGTIKGLMDGIATTEEQQTRFLETAYRRTGEMDVLLNQLFELSKMETGSMPINLQRIDLVQFLSSYTNGKQSMIDAEKEELILQTAPFEKSENSMSSEHEVEEKKELVNIDLEQMQRILDNLFENSRKYAEKEYLQMKLRSWEKNDRVILEFSDNGKGVPKEKLPYLFDEFYRGDESRSKRDGNGLGLYIVKCLVEAMGGSVSAGNREGLVIRMEFPSASQKGENDE